MTNITEANKDLRRSKSLVFTEDLGRITLDDSIWHHLINVLRIDSGHLLAVSDGNGSYQIFRTLATIAALRTAKAVRPSNKKTSQHHFHDFFIPQTEIIYTPKNSKEIAIGLAICKTDRLEWAIQKLTEVGVDHIWLLAAERSQIKSSGTKLNYDRLRKIILEAASQAKRPRLCLLHELCSVQNGYLEMSQIGKVAFAEPGGDKFSAELSAIMIGPEGGWTQDELGLSQNRISISDAILRVETAAVISGYLLSEGAR